MASGRFGTKELLDEYYKTRPETTVKRTRGQIDRAELYEYEEKINKPLVEMDSYDIVEMLKTFSNNAYTSKIYKMSYRSYDQMLSILRNFFDWYIDNYKIIKNPCNNKRIKGSNALELFSDTREAFTKKSLEDLIINVRSDQREDVHADYYEAIIRLFYEGVPESIDIVNMKASGVDHKNKTVIIRNRTIHLSDRLYELLEKLYKLDEYPAKRGEYLFLSYHGSYFKFPTRKSNEKIFESREPEFLAAYISRVFNREIKVKLDINVNARIVYLLGFYDYMVENLGKEETNRLIRSQRNSDDAVKLLSMAKEYGVVEQNVTTLKKVLLPYVST